MMNTANLGSKYARKTRIRLGGWGGLTKGGMADWKLLGKWRWKSEKTVKLWLQDPK